MNPSIFLTRIVRSLRLDIQWFLAPAIPEKLRFFFTKYIFILIPNLFWNPSRRAFGIPGWSRTTYLPDINSIAHLQSIFIDHSYLAAFIPPQGIIVDVGAHIGEFALMASVCLSPKQIISFEPVPESFSLLTENNKDTHYNLAIYSEKSLTIQVDKQSGMSSKYTIPNKVREVTVQCKTLDDIEEIQALQKIDLLKIDVEGMEYDVLECSPLTVAKSRYLVIEVAIDRGMTAGAIETLALLRTISPTIQLIHIGHIITYADTGKHAAVDMLFQNKSHHL